MNWSTCEWKLTRENARRFVGAAALMVSLLNAPAMAAGVVDGASLAHVSGNTIQALTPAIAMSSLVAFIIAGLYVLIAKRLSQGGMYLWASSWALYAVRLLFDLWTYSTPPGRPWRVCLNVLLDLVTIAGPLCMLMGAQRLFRRSRDSDRALLVMGAFLGAWSIVIHISNAGLSAAVATSLATMPIYLATAIAFAYMGVALIRSGHLGQARIRWFVGICFILAGLHKADYPLLRDAEWFAPVGFVLGASFALVIAMGLLFLLFAHALEQELMQRQRDTRATLDLLPGIAFMKDAGGTYRVVNTAMAQAVGLAPEQIEGHTDDELFPPDVARGFRLSDQQAIDARVPIYVEEVVPVAGGMLQVGTRKRPLFGNQGQLEGVIGLAFDLSERLRAEDALRQSEVRFRLLAEQLPVGVSLVGRGLQVDYLNARFTELFGYTHDDLPDTFRWFEVAFPDPVYRNEVMGGWHDTLIARGRPGVELTQTVRVRAKDGTDRIVRIYTIILSDGGQLAVFGDITAVKQAEEALRESRDELEAVFNGMFEGAVIVDMSTRQVLKVNEVFVRMFGFEPADIGNLILDRLHPPEAHDRMRSGTTRVLQGQTVTEFEMPCVRGDGTLFYVNINARPLNFRSDSVAVAFFHDVTAAREMQRETARLSTERDRLLARLELVLERMPVGCVLAGPGGLIEFWNGAAEQIFGFPRGEVIGRRPHETIVPPQSVARMDEIFSQVRGSESHVDNVNLNVTRDGQLIQCSWRIVAVHAPDGAYEGTLAMVEDVTDRLQAEASLRRYQLLAGTSRDIMLFVRYEDGRILEANQAAVDAYGYTRDELLACNLLQLRPPAARSQAPALMAAAMERGVNFEAVHCRKDGSEFPVEVSSRGAVIGGERVLVSVIRDITDRREAAERVRRQQHEMTHLSRVATVGELASGLAHELNQPLAAILNYATVSSDALRDVDGVPPVALASLKGVCREARRAAEILRRVRSFIRKEAPHRREVAINDIIREAAELMTPEFNRHHVRLEFELADEAGQVNVEPVMVQQVLVNLIQNGIDAMVDVKRDRRRIRLTSRRTDASTITVGVQDGGIGIEPAVLQRIFDSFFTTKQRGLGMGLSISRSIVELHGGRLAATCNHDGGMTFHFTLPNS